MRANCPPEVRLNGEPVTAVSCPVGEVMEKHQIAKLDPAVAAYTNLPLGSTVMAEGLLPTLEVNGEPTIAVSAPVLRSMLKPEILPWVDSKGLGSEKFAT